MPMKIILFISSLLLVVACSTQENTSEKKSKTKKPEEIPDGGSCSYKNDTLPAVILSIDPAADERSELEFYQCYDPEETDSEYCDTLSYRIVNNEYALNSEIEKQKLKTGDTVCYIMRTLTEGSCNPEISFFVLEKY